MRPFTISRMINVRSSPPRLQRFDQFPFVVAEVARIADGCHASHRTVMTNRRVPAIWAMPVSVIGMVLLRTCGHCRHTLRTLGCPIEPHLSNL
jgi:hypothetical protein